MSSCEMAVLNPKLARLREAVSSFPNGSVLGLTADFNVPIDDGPSRELMSELWLGEHSCH